MKARRAQIFFAVPLLLILSVIPATAGDWEPFETPRCADVDTQLGVRRLYSPAQPCRIASARESAAHQSYLSREFSGLVSWFQRNLSPLDGPKCPHYPTCSEFSRQSIIKYGALFGVLMTANRLTREYPGMLTAGDYPLVLFGMVRAYDPPELEYLWTDDDTVYYYKRHWRDVHKP